METPCINICAIDQVTRLCAGCYRSIDEIARWRSYSDAERARIMALLPVRRAEDASVALKETPRELEASQKGL